MGFFDQIFQDHPSILISLGQNVPYGTPLRISLITILAFLCSLTNFF